MDTTLIYRRFFTLADLVLLAVAAWAASKLIILVAVPPPGPETVRIDSPAGIQTALRTDSEADTGIILERNLFGSRISVAAPTPGPLAEEDIEQLPDSTLPLELLGTVVQVKGKGSFAIILETMFSSSGGISFRSDCSDSGSTRAWLCSLYITLPSSKGTRPDSR